MSSLPASVWQGLRLIDGIEQETDSDDEIASSAAAQRNLEHVFTLLGAALPRDAVRVAYRGLESSDPGLKGLALEYLEGVLPPDLGGKLWQALETPLEPRAERRDPAQALEALRRSTGTPIIGSRAIKSSGDDAPGKSDPPPPATKPSDPH